MNDFYVDVRQYGKNILSVGYRNGVKFRDKVEYQPYLYLKSNKPTQTKSLYGHDVERMSFSSISDAKEFIKRYEDVDGFDIFGITQFQYQYISDVYTHDVNIDTSKMTIWVIDIETASEDGFASPEHAQEAILLISVHDKNTNKNIVFGFRDYEKQDDDPFEYRLFKDEYTMLKEFCIFWQCNYPDIVTGWNIEGFDIPYIINRMNRVLGESLTKTLSPWGVLRSKTVQVFNKDAQIWDIFGVQILDYLDLYKKYTYSQRESYSLGYIAQVELNDAKHEIPGSFKDAYTYHWHDFVRYNAHDSNLVAMLDNKLKFIDVACSIASQAKCNINDTFGPVKTWDIFIYNYLKQKNVVIPPSHPKAKSSFEGAWVKDPHVGKHGWTMSFDFASLYPSIIRQWNMSPETIVGMMPGVNVAKFIEATGPLHDEYSVAANGAMFKKDSEGIIPEVVKVVLDGRKIAKTKMLELKQQYQATGDKAIKEQIASYDGRQMAFKILANSLYGAVSQSSFRYYDLRIAEAITLTGQASDKHAEIKLNEFMNGILKTDTDYVLAGDTDSLYLNAQPLVDKAYPGKTIDQTVEWLDKVAEKQIQPQINKSIDEMYLVGNCFQKTMAMKREAIASAAIWTTKKRYAMLVHNSEGVAYDPPDVKIMGLDLIKMSTPKVVRGMLKEALMILFNGSNDELFDFISKSRKTFETLSIEEISTPRGVSDIDKWTHPKTGYISRTPIHVRASILFNQYKPKDSVEIKNGDKIKFVYLKMPNPIKEDVIGFLSHESLPESMGLHKYINWELMWEKTFISPLQGLTDAIGWNVVKISSLEDFWS